jgi:5-formaminoimidazole-4-carboxamide-1-(beta)-D-ribofuranosyl 5'-monophosphate synthetase
VEDKTGFPAVGAWSIDVLLSDGEFYVLGIQVGATGDDNLYAGMQSPYMALYWDEPMWLGRRIAREIKMAISYDMVEEIVT